MMTKVKLLQEQKDAEHDGDGDDDDEEDEKGWRRPCGTEISPLMKKMIHIWETVLKSYKDYQRQWLCIAQI